MEKNLKNFINYIFKKYNEYDLYNYINGAFIDDVDNYVVGEDDNIVVDFISDKGYEIDMNYYDNKNKYGFDKGYQLLIDEIKEMKSKVSEIIN